METQVLDLLKQLLANTKKDEPIYSTVEIAALAEVSEHWLTNAAKRGEIPKIMKPGWKKPRYTAADIPWLQHAYKNRRTPEHPNYSANSDGLYNLHEAARWLDMPPITFQSWLNKKQIPPASHKGKSGYLCWTLKELKDIKRENKKYFDRRSE